MDGSSNAIPCIPDITSVTPTAELSPAPYITSTTGTSFYTTISSLSFTISGTCASDATYPVKYQLSKDGGSTEYAQLLTMIFLAINGPGVWPLDALKLRTPSEYRPQDHH